MVTVVTGVVDSKWFDDVEPLKLPEVVSFQAGRAYNQRQEDWEVQKRRDEY